MKPAAVSIPIPAPAAGADRADAAPSLSTRGRLRTRLLEPLAFVLAGFLVFYLSLCISGTGFKPTLPIDVLTGTASRAENIIFSNIRLPRAVTAAVVGAALSLAGVVMQNVLRNPLASASTLGVSQGAAFGAAVAIVFFGGGLGADGNLGAAVTVTSPLLVAACAFVFGLASAAVVLALSVLTRITPATMILSGIAMGAMFAGGTALVQYFADDIKVASIVYWTFGDVGRTGWDQIGMLAAACAAAFVFFQTSAWNYNALSNGRSTAASLGVNVSAVMITGMLAAALLSSVAVAFVGSISFVGLIAPHAARHFVGNDHRRLIFASALTGAMLLMGAEMLSRTLLAPAVLPIGAVTSFLGAPIFLWMIFRNDGWRKW